MYVETFEEILRKILRYRNNSEVIEDSDNIELVDEIF